MRVTVEMFEDTSGAGAQDVALRLHQLNRGLTWLETLVNELSSWALHGEGALPVRPAYMLVADCVAAALAVVGPLLQQRCQAVRVSQPAAVPAIVADPDRVTQALVNLLMNASAYGPVGQRIDVDVRPLPGAVEVRVTDSGPGLNPVEQARVFEPFTRGASSLRHPNGLGLGLHIVKQFAELHGGSVGVESRPDHGASFWPRLPAPAAAGAAISSRAA